METFLKIIVINSFLVCVICAPASLVDSTTGDLPKIFINSVEASTNNIFNENNDIGNKFIKTKEILDKTDELKEIEEKTKDLNEEAKELNRKLDDYEKKHIADDKTLQNVSQIREQSRKHNNDIIEDNDINNHSTTNENDLGNNDEKLNGGIEETTQREEVYYKPLAMDNNFKTIKSRSSESTDPEKKLGDDTKYAPDPQINSDNGKTSDKSFESLHANEKKVNFVSKDSIVNSVEIDDSGNKVTKAKCKNRSSQTLLDEISDDVSSSKPIYKVIYDVIKENNATIQKYWLKILKENNKVLQRKKRESDVFKNFLHNFENNIDIGPDDPFKSDETSGNKVENVEVKGERKLDDDTDVKYYHKKDNNVVKTKIDEKKDNSHVHEENMFYHYSVENKNDEISTKTIQEIMGEDQNVESTPSLTSTTTTTTTTTTSTTTTTTSTTPEPPSTDTVLNYDNRNFNDVNAMMNDNTFGNIGGNMGNVFKKMDENFENMENKLSNDFFGTRGSDVFGNNYADTTDQSPKRQVIEIKL